MSCHRGLAIEARPGITSDESANARSIVSICKGDGSKQECESFNLEHIEGIGKSTAWAMPVQLGRIEVEKLLTFLSATRDGIVPCGSLAVNLAVS